MSSASSPESSGAVGRHWTSASTFAEALNVLSLAFIALCIEQVVHELSHGITTLLVGADWVSWSFWRSSADWDRNVSHRELREAVIAGSAALVNIATAAAAMIAVRRIVRPVPRLLVLYVGAFSLFAGFGYLLVDPLFANAESTGDWAKVTMYLGGSWLVRLVIVAIGLAGTIFGYFWLGQTAMHFSFADEPGDTRKARIRRGFLLCIVPYVGTSIIFTLLALTHPRGAEGVASIGLKVWFGFIGFFWAYMIVFVWRPYRAPQGERSVLRAGIQWPVVGAGVAVLVFVLVVLIPGVNA